jgi:CheY-like chemotaxis protein
MRNSTRIDNAAIRKRLPSAAAVVAVLPRQAVIHCSPVSTRQLRVLVVDDYSDAADSLAMLVALWGHRAWVARDGQATLEMASTCQADVLLLDIAMPNMDGCQVARRLRRQARFKGTLLIALTGWADDAHRRLAEKAGFDLYLIKPVAPSTLEVLLALEQDRLAHPPAVVSDSFGQDGDSWEPAITEGTGWSSKESPRATNQALPFVMARGSTSRPIS